MFHFIKICFVVYFLIQNVINNRSKYSALVFGDFILRNKFFIALSHKTEIPGKISLFHREIETDRIILFFTVYIN